MSTDVHINPAQLARSAGCSCLKVRQLSRRISQHFDHFVCSAGLKTTQYSLLAQIVNFGPLRPIELAGRMELDASTLTRNLKPLVANGWVVVGPGTDGRSRLVAATDAGRHKWTQAKREWKRAQLALNEHLGEARLQRLHALLDECLGVMRTAADLPEE